MVKSYDPKKVVVTFGGVPISGYTDGDFIEVAPNDADGFKKQVGADGEVGRSQSNDNTHSVTITLMQSSMSNAHFHSIRTADKISGRTILPLSITDMNGASLQFWQEAWIKGDPTWGYGKEMKERQWTFDTGQIGEDIKSGLVL
jgi:hypothetical protein